MRSQQDLSCTNQVNAGLVPSVPSNGGTEAKTHLGSFLESYLIATNELQQAKPFTEHPSRCLDI